MTPTAATSHACLWVLLETPKIIAKLSEIGNYEVSEHFYKLLAALGTALRVGVLLHKTVLHRIITSAHSLRYLRGKMS